MGAPLAGVLVADFTQNVAGPYCTQILGDMGAEVVKVERPGRGDDALAWAPPDWGEESSTFMAVTRHKRSIAVDLGTPVGREVMERLVARADVFVQSLRAGTAEVLAELGYDAGAIEALLARKVVQAGSGFPSPPVDSRGPEAARARQP